MLSDLIIKESTEAGERVFILFFFGNRLVFCTKEVFEEVSALASNNMVLSSESGFSFTASGGIESAATVNSNAFTFILVNPDERVLEAIGPLWRPKGIPCTQPR